MGRRQHSNRFRRANFERLKAWKPGNHGPSTIVKTHIGYLDAGSGSGDDIEVLIHDGRYYVLSSNRRLPYIGVSVFTKDSSTVEYKDYAGRISEYDEIDVRQPDADVFAQEHQVEETFGEDWRDVSDAELVERALEYL